MHRQFASDLIKDYFNVLSENNISFYLLRGYEELPEVNNSKDVDIQVFKNQIEDAELLLLKIAKELGYTLVWSNPLDYLKGFFFIRQTDVTSFIKIDLFFDSTWKGIRFLDNDLVQNNIRKYKCFNVLSKDLEAIYLLMYSILYAKFIKESYRESLFDAFNRSSEINLLLQNVLNKNLSNKICSYILSQKWDSLKKIRIQIIHRLLLKNIKNNIFSLIYGYIQSLNMKFIKRNFMGNVISFSGPDGSGKSSLMLEIIKPFIEVGICKQNEPEHFVHSKIPAIHKVLPGPTKIKNQDYTKPYSFKSSGFFVSWLRLIYYWLMFVVIEPILLKKTMKENNIVFYDRCYIDLIVDPNRARIGISSKIVSGLFRIKKKPTASVIIIANANIILERKDELNELKLKQLLKNYRTVSKLYNLILIENNDSIDTGYNKSMKALIQKLNKEN